MDSKVNSTIKVEDPELQVDAYSITHMQLKCKGSFHMIWVSHMELITTLLV